MINDESRRSIRENMYQPHLQATIARSEPLAFSRPSLRRLSELFKLLSNQESLRVRPYMVLQSVEAPTQSFRS
jgi:hypothetical protein